MGSVYRAQDERSGKAVAVKQLTLTGQAEDDARFRGWFQRELKALTLLDHEGVLRLIDHGEDNGTPFVVTELLDGADLGAIVEQGGPLPEAVGLRIAERALAAVAAAHALEIAHRDLKPSNIFLCRNGRVVVLDFGLARGLSSEQSKTMAQGFGTNVMGTPHYLAPEQLAGVKLSLSADLFSFASTFFYLFSGQQAFVGETVLEVVRAIAHNERQPLRAVMPTLSGATCAFIEKLMMPDPADRPADAGAARKLLALAVAKSGASDDELQHFALDADSSERSEHTATMPVPQTENHTRMVSVPAAVVPSKRRTLRWAALLAGGIVAFGLLGVWLARPRSVDTVDVVTEAPLPLPKPLAGEVPTPKPVPEVVPTLFPATQGDIQVTTRRIPCAWQWRGCMPQPCLPPRPHRRKPAGKAIPTSRPPVAARRCYDQRGRLTSRRP